MRFVVLILCVLAATPVLADRVLSIGGSVTEIVYALGQEDRLVGRDSTSSWPAEAEALPDVGYMRALSPEGVLSVAPDLIIAEAGSGPPEVIDVLRESGVTFIEVPDGYTPEAVSEKIMAVGGALGVEDAARALVAEVGAELAASEAAALASEEPKRVLFILSMKGGRVMASGDNTAADGIIELAGGVNAIEAFEGYKPLTDEAITAANPDVILMMDRGGDHAAADGDLWATPAISTTPAAQTQSVVRINGLLLLGFGPRTPEAVTTLNQALYGSR